VSAANDEQRRYIDAAAAWAARESKR
jgi:hypothetical protein